MDYVELTIQYHSIESQVIIGVLSQFAEIQSMEESENWVKAYLDHSSYKLIKKDLHQIADQYHWTIKAKVLPTINWNEEWEKNFEPIQIGDLCLIRADFHAANSKFKYEIILNPKNAFGTGHHETTYLMMDSMRSLTWHEKKCLDLGTGTGILSIWAYLLGCRDIVAIDNTMEAVENTRDNFARNQLPSHFEALHGTIEVIGDQKFDVTLANINRQVLQHQAEAIRQCLNSNADLILSGVLHDDVSSIIKKYQGLRLVKIAHKGEWSLLHFRKVSD